MDGFSIAMYMVSSSTMLVMNKLTIEYFQRPILLLLFQLSFVSVVVTVMFHLKFIHLSDLSFDVLKRFWVVPIAFLMTLFCNIQILKHSNVETFIVLRASTPIILSLLDVQFLGRRLPHKKSWVSIIGVLIFACVYVYYENAKLTSDSIFWLVCWYLMFCFDQIYIKHIVDTVKMTMWDRVWYTNTIPIFILAPAAFALEEPITVSDPTVFVYIASTCLIGILISYSSFLVRKSVAATTFTVIGNTCKLITVIINYVIWDKHASPYAIVALLICIGFSSTYKQSELDKDSKDMKKLRWFYLGFFSVMTVLCLSIYNPVQQLAIN